MDLISFEEKLLPRAFGFRNMGATCYFNSLLQALLSCTSLSRVMMENRNVQQYQENMVAASYIKLLEMQNADASALAEMSPVIWQSIIKQLNKKSSHAHFGHGQEDSHESFKMLMECWEDLEDVIRLFTHKDHVSIYCTVCCQWNNSQSEDANNKNSSNEILRFYELVKGIKSEIPPELEKLVKIPDRENGTIEGFLTRQITYMDEGYRCNCYKTIYYDNRHELKNIPCRCVCDNEKKARAKNCSCTSDELKSNNGNCLDVCNCPCLCGGLCKYRCNSKIPKLKIVSMKILPEILVLMCPAKVAGKYYEEFPPTLNFDTKLGKKKYKVICKFSESLWF